MVADPSATEGRAESVDGGAERFAEASPAKRLRTESTSDAASEATAKEPVAVDLSKPPPFRSGEDYAAAADGWMAHKGGQWLYTQAEKVYFHLPTGQLHLATDAEGGTSEFKPLQTGIVRWFNSAKGFGFIAPTDGGADVFVHRNQIASTETADDAGDDVFAALKKGARVAYLLGETEEGRPCATGVHIDAGASLGSGPLTDDAADDDDEDADSASSVELDLEAELGSGFFQLKGTHKDQIEDFVVENVKLPISVLGETASCFYYGVYDGHAGTLCAEYAASHLAKNILARLRDRPKGASDEVAMKAGLLGGFKQTEHNFLQRARKIGDCSGSTACTMTVYGPDEQMRLRLFLANLGDSRAVLGKLGGVAVRLTQDHKPNVPSERKRIELEGGSVGRVQDIWRCILPPNRHANSAIVGLSVSRSFGDKEFKSPDLVSAEPEISIHEVDWDADEFVILGSDGIWDVISDKEAVRLVRNELIRNGTENPIADETGRPPIENEKKRKDEERAAEALVRRAVEKGSHDDCSALIVRFGWLKLPTATVGRAAADPAGLFQGLVPTKEEIAAAVGPQRLLTSASSASEAATDAGAEVVQVKPAVNDDLDMFG